MCLIKLQAKLQVIWPAQGVKLEAEITRCYLWVLDYEAQQFF